MTVRGKDKKVRGRRRLGGDSLVATRGKDKEVRGRRR